MKICPKCGTEFEDTNEFCSKCGSELVDKEVKIDHDIASIEKNDMDESLKNKIKSKTNNSKSNQNRVLKELKNPFCFIPSILCVILLVAVIILSSNYLSVQKTYSELGYDTNITYEDLERNPIEYMDEKVSFSGEVLQVIENSDDYTTQIRFAVNGDIDSVLWGEYDPAIVDLDSRIIEGDYITIYGTSGGIITYESAIGSEISIPGVWIEKIDMNN